MTREFDLNFRETDQEKKEQKEGLARNPVFVVGVPRSGTTMLYNILVRHHSFAGNSEPVWNTETSIFKKFIRHTNGFFEEGKWPFWYEYFGGNREQFRQFQKESIRSFLVNAALARGATRVLEKTPNHVDHLDLMFETFPQASAVHIIRHPVDVYASMRKRAQVTPPDKDPWLKVDHDTFAQDYVRKVNGTEKYKMEGRLLTVRYEDLTSSPDTEVRKVLEFIGEDFDESIVIGSAPVMTEGKFPYQSNVPVPNSNNWGGLVSSTEVEGIQKICMPVMQRHDYEKYK